MTMARDRWVEVTPSPHPWEREALAFLRDRLPDHEPWRAWTNFQFLADDGSVNEVDALVVGPGGVFLVEIKSHPGEVTGDDRTLRIRGADGARATIDHPLYLANLKAKRLKGRLARTATGAKQALPRIEALVFLSAATAIQLPAPANTGLYPRDRQAAGPQAAVDGILAALIHRRGPGLRPDLPVRIDKPMAKALGRALDEIGLSSIPGKPRVRDYEVVELIEETPQWRDQLGKHVSTAGSFRRIRRYFAEPGSPLDREAVTRAAEREFQLLDRLHHPEILAVKEFTTDEQGPLLLFEHLSGSKRLDRYLEEEGARLSLEARLALLRRVAEAVRYAHASQIVHRNLSPHSILVVPGASGEVSALRVMNWSAGAYGPGGTTSQPVVGPTQHPESHSELTAAVYLAPELRQNPTSTDATLDVFSLGSLAWRLITGQPPASTSDELLERVKDSGLRLASTIEGSSQTLETLVARATEGNVQRRFASVDEFLEALDRVSDTESTPDDHCPVPPEAVAGSRLENGLLVKRRLGSGSTAVAFLVERQEETGAETYILKVARDPDQSKRIAAEASVLRQLEHAHIARFVAELDFGAYKGFLTRPANEETLRQRLSREGPLQLELLERFGEQLLGALIHLEERGINHRDIKPDNIAVTDFGRRQALGLVLFDFSLSGASPDDLNVGTITYSDPFLRERKPPRWDLNAERYSAALTLYEMTTGTLPSWGDSRSVPLATEAEQITLEPERFPAGLRDNLVTFFRKALARQSETRFDNAAAMLEEWRGVFRGTEHSSVVEAPEDAEATLIERTRALGVRTPLHELPFSTRAANALDRLSFFTVEELLRVPPIRLLQSRGVGAKTRTELDQITRALRRLFPDVPISAEPAASGSERPRLTSESLATASLDELHHLLHEDARRKKALLDAFEVLVGPSSALEVRTQVEAAHALALTPQQLQPTLTQLRKLWAASPAGQVVLQDLASIVERHHGVLSFHEASEALLGQRRSVREGNEALALAAALVRIATEIESQAEVDDPRWWMRRRDDRVWLTREDGLVRYARDLGQRAIELAQQEPLPSREAVESELGQVARPTAGAALPPGRLARLAIAAAQDRVDLSGRGEIYPVGLDATRAIRLSVGALVGAGGLVPEQRGRLQVSVEEVHQRIRSRYPRAAVLPGRPQLDDLLRQAGWEADWDEALGRYVTRIDDQLTMVTGSSTSRTARPRERVSVTPGTEPTDPAFEERLTRVLDSRRFLVLKVEARDLDLARYVLETRFAQLESLDLDAEIVAALRAILKALEIDASLFFEAEAAGPESPQWTKVLEVMRQVLERVTAGLTTSERPLLLRNVGLLARYGIWLPIETLNPQMGARAPRGALVLVPGDSTKSWAEVGTGEMPALPGQVIPVPEAFLAPLRPALVAH